MSWIKNKNIFLGVLKYYGYVSTFLVGFLTFWFGIDPLKTSEKIYLKSITVFLNDNIIGIIAFSAIGLLLKILRDKNIERELNLQQENTERELNLQQKINQKLSTDLINLSEALKDLSQDILRNFSIEKLESETGEQMRVSLYVKNKEGNLYCLGRYSKNSDFSNFSQTTIYKEKGIIVKSWREGNENGYGKFDNGFPDIKHAKKYRKHQELNYGLTEEDINNMKMKSRLYYSYRVEYHGENLGVILIESLANDKYTKYFLDSVIKDLEKRIILVLNSTFKYLDAPKTYSSNQI